MSKKERKIMLIKTDKGCFITDCQALEGYDYDYHSSIIPELKFDDKQAGQTFLKNWFCIKKYPNKITKQEPDSRKNDRYELIDKEMESKKLPLTMAIEDLDYEHNVYDLYKREYETITGKWIEHSIEISTLMEVDKFELPTPFEYNGIAKVGWNEKEVVINRHNLNHSVIHKMVVPEIMLHNTPCLMSSVDLYKIVRSHVKKHIDLGVSEITSDYDFCFTVKKKIPHFKPIPFTYNNHFARTKAQRRKIHKGISEYKSVEVFQMTDDQQRYGGYTPIKPIEAKSDNELKVKIDYFLSSLMECVNKKIVACSHCEGAGWIDGTERFKQVEDKKEE